MSREGTTHNGPSAAWSVFDWVLRLRNAIATTWHGGRIMLQQMWHASPVAACIAAVLALAAIVVAFLILRFAFRAIFRTSRSLIRLARRTARRARLARRRRLLPDRFRTAPTKAVAEYAFLVRGTKISDASWLEKLASHEIPFCEHIKAFNALITLQARLPEKERLTGYAVVLEELHSRLPELANHLINQMDELAVIQHSLDNGPGIYSTAYWTASAEEAINIRKYLERITRDIPELLAASFSAARADSLKVDLEGLSMTIRKLADTAARTNRPR